ncbi:hypothetical protein TNCV_1379481 [Trichonephila clavipes]|nr:hypothetical protein TNCV_1379481 [Trichonephila clavipes]
MITETSLDYPRPLRILVPFITKSGQSRQKNRQSSSENSTKVGISHQIPTAKSFDMSRSMPRNPAYWPAARPIAKMHYIA